MALFNETELAVIQYVSTTKLPVTDTQIASEIGIGTFEIIPITKKFVKNGIFENKPTKYITYINHYIFWRKRVSVMAYSLTSYGKEIRDLNYPSQRQNSFGGLISKPT